MNTYVYTCASCCSTMAKHSILPRTHIFRFNKLSYLAPCWRILYKTVQATLMHKLYIYLYILVQIQYLLR